MENLKSNEAFHPSEYIADELEARGWTVEYFAQQLDNGNFFVPKRHVVFTKKLLAGDIDITVDIAERLSKAFSTSTELWIGLQRSYNEKNNKRRTN
jgi:HTH-type transcriptional regulator/antitoxin HigA